ncbi:hypothetical protein VOLCADRAFT_87265 [Volvox carteri f. nagariensis]|uniref:Peptidase S1 domain-containing protein n=1 Tax=Volvox carteri f. nagariensis TaxID=3068 RepID=D8TKV9_VOLCA|nr:uncharacterized protein VOLCADRAFT_87265 [Volvox carteri f. nagariensis]EFJ51632.1 hypothetical protein VOLCADRAFT_87265 [Volvox carteri f. nagariensis]|eukprot:XP_002947042.1 hypothetical protein VOLCADRAFT_87265 [Volvox carteri f. nagariensis]
MTVAHCVYDPLRDIWWPGLEFSAGAGRNGASAWAPYGTVTWRATEVPKAWRRSGGAGAPGAEMYDYALVVLAEPLGRRLGWMQPGGCGLYDRHFAVHTDAGGGVANAERAAAGFKFTEKQPQPITVQVRTGCKAARSSAAGGGGGGGAGRKAYLPVHPYTQMFAAEPPEFPIPHTPCPVAGYPDDKENGTLWREVCRVMRAAGGGGGGSSGGSASDGGSTASALSYHDCNTRGGNSGSPLWVMLLELRPPPWRRWLRARWQCMWQGREYGAGMRPPHRRDETIN